MKERPILFGASMVRAILSGAKTQTRRTVKPQPTNMAVRATQERPGVPCKWYDADCVNPGIELRCPYGEHGDRLWVRETWRTERSLDDRAPSMFSAWPVWYAADGAVRLCGSVVPPKEAGKTRVSIHMPRWASRITLEVTGVRVERLQDITEEDARAEGTSGRAEFRTLWNAINGAGSWDANPWVWALSFRRVTP